MTAARNSAGAEPRADAAEDDRFWLRTTVLFLVISSALRLCLLPLIELSADEAYYWDWSRRLDLGYYDQGPLIAYLIRLTTTLAGTSEFGVRVGVWAVMVGTLVCVYRLTRRFASARAAFLAVLFLALTPLFAAGSMIATYDPPLVLFWALALLCLERALFAPDPRVQTRGWILAGVACGLGLLSKHTMLLIVPCLLLFLTVSKAHRFWLLRPQPYAAFLIMAAMYSGDLWWNATHHWWTFGHLGFLAGKKSGTPLRQFGDLVGSQAVLIGPGLFVGSVWAFWSAARAEWQRARQALPAPAGPVGASRAALLFLFCFGAPVFCFFCLMTLKAKVQANWAPCTWITPAIALAISISARIQGAAGERRRAIRQAWLVAAPSAALTLLLLCPWLRYHAGIRQLPQDDISNRTYGARQMAHEVNALRGEMERDGKPVFIAANDYQTCALLAFYLPDRPRTFELFLGYRLNNYAVGIEDLRGHIGENAIYANETMGEDPQLRELFERVEWSGPYPVWRRPYFAAPIRIHYYARCYGYRRYIGLQRANGG